MIDPISQTILKKIEERAKTESKHSIAYRRQCPKCMKWQVKETLLREGCFACGWKQKEEIK